MLENSYYLLSALMLCIVLGAYIKQVIVNISDTKARLKKIIFAVIPFALWLVYLSLIQGSSIIQDLNLPPKFPILILLPLAILFVLFYFFNRKLRCFFYNCLIIFFCKIIVNRRFKFFLKRQC